VREADPDQDSVGGRLVEMSREAGRPQVTSQLRHAMGRATCPGCAEEFDVPDALT
jgi:hypothetical protein